jgi:hypothetical protein
MSRGSARESSKLPKSLLAKTLLHITATMVTGKRERGGEETPRKRARVSFAPLVLVRTEAEAAEACEHRAPRVAADTSASRRSSVVDTSELAKEKDGPNLVSSVVANLVMSACEGHLASPRAVLEALHVCLAVLSGGDGTRASNVHFVSLLLDRLQHLATRLEANGSVALLPLDYCLSAKCSRDCQVLHDTQRVMLMFVASAESQPLVAPPGPSPGLAVAAASAVHA